jgi:hypothetical protein
LGTAESLDKTMRVIDAVASGMPLGRALQANDLQARTFHRTIARDKEACLQYSQAREIQSDIAVDEAVEIADDPNIDPQRARNMIDVRKWRASKHAPRTFGDRVDVNFQGSISVSDALAEARQRLATLPGSFQPLVIDATVIDTIGVSHDEPSDTESDAPGPALQVSTPAPAEPDIFS